jgi:hypothetical protein
VRIEKPVGRHTKLVRGSTTLLASSVPFRAPAAGCQLALDGTIGERIGVARPRIVLFVSGAKDEARRRPKGQREGESQSRCEASRGRAASFFRGQQRADRADRDRGAVIATRDDDAEQRRRALSTASVAVNHNPSSTQTSKE